MTAFYTTTEGVKSSSSLTRLLSDFVFVLTFDRHTRRSKRSTPESVCGARREVVEVEEMDTWSEIREFQRRHRSVMSRLRRKRKQRRQRLYEARIPYIPPSISTSTSSPVLSSPSSSSISSASAHPSTPVNENWGPALERRAQEQLLNPLLEYPLSLTDLSSRLKEEEGVVWGLLLKFNAQKLLELQLADSAVASINADRLSALVEAGAGGTKREESLPSVSSCKTRRDYEEFINKMLDMPSIRETESRKMGTEIHELLNTKSVMEQMQLEKFQSVGGSQLQEFCSHKTRDSCRRARGTHRACGKLHFRKIIQAHTDESLGDCSFLNTCFHTDTCKFVHYEIDTQREIDSSSSSSSQRQSIKNKPTTAMGSHKMTPAQWINCDIRILDMNSLGKFSVIMADPPWDIHMELPYGTMGDDEMRQLNVPALQDDGYIFLWVTGRAMELGRECLTLWGYDRVDELIWVKTNQLQRLIRTGRTGHWLNHGKEHCLVGVKGNLPVNRGIDVDVVVAEVRETSRKPDEIYGVIERLSPGTLKVELFGRMHNCQPNWLTVGNQLEGVNLVEEDRTETFLARYPNGEQDLFARKMVPPPAPLLPPR